MVGLAVVQPAMITHSRPASPHASYANGPGSGAGSVPARSAATMASSVVRPATRNCSANSIDALNQAMKCPTYMPAAVATAYQLLRAKRNTVKSDMPICIAMLQNQAKNITCQNVNFIWPGKGCPPRQITSSANRQSSPSELTEAPVMSMNCRSATSPKARKTSTIQGAAMLATRATMLYPYAATTEINAPTPSTASTQPPLFG